MDLKLFDANWIITELNQGVAGIIVSQHPNRRSPLAIDLECYKWRHLIENFFARLKQYRAIATRYDKTACNFLAAVYLAAAVDWLN